MKAKLTVDMDNAAFEEAGPSVELARILREIANRIDGVPVSAGDWYAAMDANGNKVGRLIVK